VADNGVINTGRQTQWQASPCELPKRVLFLHDSFGEAMIPYLTRLFGEVHAIWDSVLSEATIKTIAPDLIIVERIERFLILLPQITPPSSPLHVHPQTIPVGVDPRVHPSRSAPCSRPV